jgi:hypothetical protein
MGKRKARAREHHDGNQTSGDDFHAKNIHAVSAAANCNHVSRIAHPGSRAPI